MPLSGIRAAVLTAVIALALLAGCASKPKLRVAPPAPLTNAWAIAVYPVVFRLSATAYEAYVRGRAIGERLSTLTGRAVFGPGEFRLDDLDADDLRVGTNLAAAVKYSKARRPEDLHALRVEVEQRVTKGSSLTYDAAGVARAKSRGEDEIDVVVRLELLSLGAREVVAEIEGVARIDAFSEATDKDPLADVTRLTNELLEVLVESTGLRAQQPRKDLGLRAIAVPGPALAFSLPGLPSMRELLSKVDALEQDSQLLGLFLRLDPAATRTRIRTYRSAPTGLLVLEVGGAAATAGLAAEDLMLTADGEAVTGTYVLDRHLDRGPVKLKVRRAGEELEFEIRR